MFICRAPQLLNGCNIHNSSQNLFQSQVWPAPYTLGSMINLKLLAKCNLCKVQLWEPTILLNSFLKLRLWDPGGLLHNCQAMDLPLVIHVQARLGNKPCFKEGSKSRTSIMDLLGYRLGRLTGEASGLQRWTLSWPIKEA
jgi:hypothetical protein